MFVKLSIKTKEYFRDQTKGPNCFDSLPKQAKEIFPKAVTKALRELLFLDFSAHFWCLSLYLTISTSLSTPTSINVFVPYMYFYQSQTRSRYRSCCVNEVT